MYQVHLKAKNGAEMPACSYGAACTRKGCIYKHPPKKVVQKPSSDAPICAAFLAGECAFGSKCRNRHVSPEEAAKIRQRDAKTPCRFGSSCTTKDCLFAHPPPTPCPNGLACKVVNCRFIHPDPEVIAAAKAEAPALPQKPRDPSEEPIIFPKSEALLRREQEEEAADNVGILTLDELAKFPCVKTPQDAIVASWARNQGHFHMYADRIERFLAVNATSPRGVIDLHYQTTRDVIPVMEAALNKRILNWDWQYYDANEKGVWLITGAGIHSKGNRPLIFDVVLDHLVSTGRRFKLTKDMEGNYGGFYLMM